jgi:hypothetical protein
MLDAYQLTVHGLTRRQLASAEQLAEVTGQPFADVVAALEKAVTEGAVMAPRGNYMITPAGRSHLDDVYPEAFAEVRSSAAVAHPGGTQ